VVKPLTDFIISGNSLLPSPYFRNYVYIQRTERKACWCQIGMSGKGEQIMWVNPHPYQGCTSKVGYLTHEMMHSLGYDHEQSRKDRDDFVFVNYSNIRSGK
jgi:hypothetical protein